MSYSSSLTRRLCWQLFAVAIASCATPSIAEQPAQRRPSQQVSKIDQAEAPPAVPVANEVRHEQDVDIYALMSGRCSNLKVAGREFRCRAVAFFHTEGGRAKFTVALDDPTDDSHIISFSGENGWRTEDNLYELPIDRMLLNSKDRPRVDGLPVPFVELSAGICRQTGNFAKRQVSSISCSAVDNGGRRYELAFESDGSPITVRRVRHSRPTIRLDPFN